jgi:hypothetical protein
MVCFELESPVLAPIPRNCTAAGDRSTDMTIAAGKRGELGVVPGSPAESRALIVDFSDNGPSAISSAIRILPGGGALKMVKVIHVVAAPRARLEVIPSDSAN